MSKTKRRSKKKSGTKKNKERKYYPNSLIGKGSYKSVYDLISETNKQNKRRFFNNGRTGSNECKYKREKT